MEDGLPGYLAHVDAHIKGIGMETLVNFLLHILQHYVHGLVLVVRQIEVGSNVPLGDDERMTKRDGITVVEDHADGRLADDFTRRDRQQKEHFSPSTRGSLLKWLYW